MYFLPLLLLFLLRQYRHQQRLALVVSFYSLFQNNRLHISQAVNGEGSAHRKTVAAHTGGHRTRKRKHLDIPKVRFET
jgi:hypothetical protein